MLKILFLIGLVGSGGWWYFHGGRLITEDSVKTFYAQMEHATLSRDPDMLCHLLADDFKSISTTAANGDIQRATHNKRETCDGYRDMYQGFEQLGEKMGGILQLDLDYSVDSIEISPDRKTAVVATTYKLDVAGSIMNIRATSKDTLIRRNGTMFLLRSEGSGSINGRPSAR